MIQTLVVTLISLVLATTTAAAQPCFPGCKIGNRAETGPVGAHAAAQTLVALGAELVLSAAAGRPGPLAESIAERLQTLLPQPP